MVALILVSTSAWQDTITTLNQEPSGVAGASNAQSVSDATDQQWIPTISETTLASMATNVLGLREQQLPKSVTRTTTASPMQSLLVPLENTAPHKVLPVQTSAQIAPQDSCAQLSTSTWWNALSAISAQVGCQLCHLPHAQLDKFVQPSVLQGPTVSSAVSLTHCAPQGLNKT